MKVKNQLSEEERWRRWKRHKNIMVTIGIIMFIAGILMILLGSP